MARKKRTVEEVEETKVDLVEEPVVEEQAADPAEETPVEEAHVEVPAEEPVEEEKPKAKPKAKQKVTVVKEEKTVEPVVEAEPVKSTPVRRRILHI
jgi:hypothetical protein